MPALRIEIEATDRIEAKRVEALYQRGERHVKLDDEAIEEARHKGWGPLSAAQYSSA